MRRPLLAGNWKMNGARSHVTKLANAIALQANDLNHMDLVLLPPTIFIPRVADALKGTSLQWGGQNICQHDNGAYTGETSARMLREYDCQYVTIGHSERRTHYQESDDVIRLKVQIAIKHGMNAILCVGESLADREQDRTESVIAEQLNTVFSALTNSEINSLIVAYEPIWAIGTGQAASAEQANQVHHFIRQEIGRQFNSSAASHIRIIYGGSVKPDNAANLFAESDIDGGLIGGCSLKAKEFIAICNAYPDQHAQ